MADKAHRDKRFREGLFSAMLSDGGREEVYNAAWALTHLPAVDDKYIDDYRGELVRLAVSTADASIRRLALTLLERLDWGRDAVGTDLLDFNLKHMIMAGEPYGVRALCVKLAYVQCRHYPELVEELKLHLSLMEDTDMSPGLKHAYRHVLDVL